MNDFEVTRPRAVEQLVAVLRNCWCLNDHTRPAPGLGPVLMRVQECVAAGKCDCGAAEALEVACPT